MENRLRGDEVDGSRNYELEGDEECLDQPKDYMTIDGSAPFTITDDWRAALRYKAVAFIFPTGKATWGFKVLWYLYSADIWFGNFPLLKFIVGVNILIWVIWLWKTV